MSEIRPAYEAAIARTLDSVDASALQGRHVDRPASLVRSFVGPFVPMRLGGADAVSACAQIASLAAGADRAAMGAFQSALMLLERPRSDACRARPSRQQRLTMVTFRWGTVLCYRSATP